ncbi:MAG: hypothetical protein EON54_08630 [Alcaligenaceae bacterium]|nr:MAG: hypothetical protein EON54_08630 [Alcaligenaceae bacterium]
MSAYDEYKLDLRELLALVPWGHKYVLSELQTPGCPQPKPIMANDTEIRYFAGQKLYDIGDAQRWAKAFMLWKASEQERKRLARAEWQKSVDDAMAKSDAEIKAREEQQAQFRDGEEQNRRMAARRQEEASQAAEATERAFAAIQGKT